jgi:DnaJ-class molecular chaperone
VKEELEELVTGSKHALKAMLENRCEECGGTGKVSYHYYDEVEIEEECDCRKAS